MQRYLSAFFVADIGPINRCICSSRDRIGIVVDSIHFWDSVHQDPGGEVTSIAFFTQHSSS